MPEWNDTGIILSLRPHGETGAVASIMTEVHGRATGYVYGAVSARTRGTLEPGNIVTVNWKAKEAGQLGQFALELEKSHAADVMDDRLKLTALQAACALADKTMPENERHQGVYAGTRALLASFSGDVWGPAYIFWELALLRELGFGLDLSKCAATGDTQDLIYVSPRSGAAVSRAAGEVYKEKLLKLPPFLRGEARFEREDILDGLKLTGHFLLHRVFAAAHAQLPEPRQRLEEKFGAA